MKEDNYAKIAQIYKALYGEYRVKQVSERSYPANFIAKTDKFINLPTGFSKSLIYQALLLVCDTVHGTTGHYCCCCFAPGNSWKIKLQKLENIGIPSVTLSDISKENMRVVERGTCLLYTSDAADE